MIDKKAKIHVHVSSVHEDWDKHWLRSVFHYKWLKYTGNGSEATKCNEPVTSCEAYDSRAV